MLIYHQKINEFCSGVDLRINPTGKISYFKNDHKENCWARVYEANVGGEYFYTVYCGNYKSGQEFEWKSDRGNISTGDWIEAAAELEKHRKKNALEKKKRQKETTDLCKLYFDDAAKFTSDINHYPQTKFLNAAPNCKIGKFQFTNKETLEKYDRENCLLIPVYNSKGFVGTQVIYNNGQKYFKYWPTGIEKRGSFHVIGPNMSESESFIVTEGWATGQSLSIAVNKKITVICAMDAGNLDPVIEQIRAKFPNKKILIAADNDQFTVIQDKLVNIGEEKATSAVNKFNNVTMISPTFLSLDSKPTDFNDLHILEGISAVESQIGAALEVDATADMIQALGHHEGQFYYYCPKIKEVHSFAATTHFPLNLLGLESLDYWCKHYPTQFVKDEYSPHWQQVADQLMGECRKAGNFSPKNRRGFGAWNDNEKVVFNFGETILCDGKMIPTYEFNKTTKNFYEVRKSLDIPREELSKENREIIFDCFKSLCTKNNDEYRYILGWVVLSQIQSCLSWRPHIWLTGERGTGKSTVLELIKSMSPLALYVQDASEAGIRQGVENNAFPIIYDESEPDGKKMKSIIALARQSSSSNEALVLRGSVSGKATQFRVTTSFAFGSIQVGMLNPADESRIMVIELDSNSREEFLKLDNLMTQTKKLSNALLWFVLDNIELLKKNIEETKLAVQECGIESRLIDQVSPLIAGAHLVEKGAVEIDADYVHRVIKDINFMESEYMSENQIKDKDDCYSTLMGLPIQVDLLEGRIIPLSQCIQILESQSVFDNRTKHINNSLGLYGIRYFKETKELFIASKNRMLTQLFERISDYSKYITLLRRVDSCHRNGTVRVANNPVRGIYLQMDFKAEEFSQGALDIEKLFRETFSEDLEMQREEL